MYVGRGGSGTLNVTNGAAVSMGSYGVGYIGYESGSTGVVTVDGADSTFYSGQTLHADGSENRFGRNTPARRPQRRPLCANRRDRR